ncbi:MAG TPA: hypothetical protein PLE74_04655 [Candidatus Cloacimonadota bacterium]|nr:hypothetical protein [Candidatus Cloacimonadota bacterium]HPT71551.1 hypothetical protein [Candidatus Cloacimonadota bacterium]
MKEHCKGLIQIIHFIEMFAILLVLSSVMSCEKSNHITAPVFSDQYCTSYYFSDASGQAKTQFTVHDTIYVFAQFENLSDYPIKVKDLKGFDFPCASYITPYIGDYSDAWCMCDFPPIQNFVEKIYAPHRIVTHLDEYSNITIPGDYAALIHSFLSVQNATNTGIPYYKEILHITD